MNKNFKCIFKHLTFPIFSSWQKAQDLQISSLMRWKKQKLNKYEPNQIIQTVKKEKQPQLKLPLDCCIFGSFFTCLLRDIRLCHDQVVQFYWVWNSRQKLMQYCSLYELTSSVRAGTGNSRDIHNHKDAHTATAASSRCSNIFCLVSGVFFYYICF